MKRLVLAMAVLTGVGSFAYAKSFSKTEIIPSVTNVLQDNYREINMNDLNEYVQTAIKSFENTHDVKKVEYSTTLRRTRVTLQDKVTLTRRVVILGDDGNEIK